MITDIEVQKFKKFKNPVKIEKLSQVNYLVGKNNSGKTSFLQAILLSAMYRNETGEAFENPNLQEKFARLIEYFNDEKSTSPIKVVFNTNSNENLAVEWDYINNSLSRKPQGTANIPKVLYIPCGSQFKITRDKASYNEIDRQIKVDGILPIDNINSWIHNNEIEARDGNWNPEPSDKFNKLREIIKKEFSVEILDTKKDRDNNINIRFLENGTSKNLYLLGSGAQNIIYLITAIVYSREYDLILIDEPEAHLHPELQKKLGDIFRELSKKFEIQFIIATQSPFIISNLTSEESVYIFKNNDNIKKENNFINVSVSMELGCEPSDVGAPENFVLLEEASMQTFLSKVNERIFNKNIQFISCAGINKVPRIEGALKNVIDHDVLLKCTPIYLNKYLVVADKITEEIEKDELLKKLRDRLGNRFIQLPQINLEDMYLQKHIDSFIETRKEEFKEMSEKSNREKLYCWLNKDEEMGMRKNLLAEFVGNNITKEDFCSSFEMLIKVF